MSGVDFAALFEQKKKSVSSSPGATKPTARADSNPRALSAPSSSIAKSKKKKKKKKAREATEAPSLKPGAAAASAPPQPQGSSDAKVVKKHQQQLAGAQFRYINEQLYTRPSADAVQLFAEEPELFQVYHEGFRSQAARWPMRPVQAIADWLQTKARTWVVADLGCGDAELATIVPQKVRSFDLVAANPSVVACDIANVPLPDASVHVCVFCLALMGVNFSRFLCEAHRLLKPRGVLKIAEVASRIEDPAKWDRLLHALGFDAVSRDDSNSHFTLFELIKSDRPMETPLPEARLKPCIYKRR